MEGSGAVAGDSTATAGDGGGQGTEGTAEAQNGGIPAELAETLSTLSAGQEELRQFLQAQQTDDGADEGDDGDDPLDLSFMDPVDPEFDPAQVAERLGGLIDQAAERRAQALVSPVQQEVAEMRRTNEARDLIGEFPELGDEKVASEVVKLSQQIAEAHVGDRAEAEKLASEPWFWRMTYMAAKAAESANDEGGSTPPAAQLEGGGGAAPAGGTQVDLGDQIVAGSHGGRSVLPF